MTTRLLSSDDRVLLFGGGGHAVAVRDVVRRVGAGVIATVDPRGNEIQSDAEGIAVATRERCSAVICIGDNDARVALGMRLLDAGVELPAIVAPSATIGANVRMGDGTIVMEHTHVGPAATLGRLCIVNTAASVDHECVLGDGVHSAPGSVLTGGVVCGDLALVGAGAVVIPGATVGARAIVGAGGVVLADVPVEATVVGVPATPRLAGRKAER